MEGKVCEEKREGLGRESPGPSRGTFLRGKAFPRGKNPLSEATLGATKGSTVLLSFASSKRRNVLSCENNGAGQGGPEDRKMASPGRF